MVCPAFCSPHSSGDEDITNVAPADNDIRDFKIEDAMSTRRGRK